MYDLLSRLDPELRATMRSLAGWRVEAIEDIPELRRALLAQKPLPDVSGWAGRVDVSDTVVESAFGTDVPVRVYRPSGRQGPLPAVVFFRGSGFIIGHVRQFDPLLCELCQRTGCAFVSVDYPLAPTAPFPAAFEDCYGAFLAVAKRPESLNLDGDRLALMGVSAGGGMALCAALSARADGVGQPRLLLPLYPMLDPLNDRASSRLVQDDRVWDGDKNGKGWRAYLGERISEKDARFAPLCADTFAGLPPVATFIGQEDALRDETIELVARLCQDGVSCDFRLFSGCYHSFETGVPASRVSREAKDFVAGAIRRALCGEEGEIS